MRISDCSSDVCSSDLPTAELGSGGISQFAPGAIGGYNAGNGFDGSQSLNFWDLILALEGALLFAGAVTSRLTGGSRAEASMPFTVDARTRVVWGQSVSVRVAFVGRLLIKTKND